MKRPEGETGLEMVIMAAGESRRYGRLKQLEGFGPQGQPILFYTLYDGVRSGVRCAVLVISEDHRDEFQRRVVEPWSSVMEIKLVAQQMEDLPVLPLTGPGPAARAKPWGTGHAVWAVRHEVKGSFILANADDFYGRKAIANVAGHLKSAAIPATWALQAYNLGETLLDEGEFSRGFCQVDEAGHLQSIAEHQEVRRSSLTSPGQWVSMNLWGYDARVFPLLEETFHQFLADHGNEPQREFFLPDAIQQGIAKARCQVRVLPPAGQWFGVTNPEDAADVRAHLARLHDEGTYPEDLPP